MAIYNPCSTLPFFSPHIVHSFYNQRHTLSVTVLWVRATSKSLKCKLSRFLRGRETNVTYAANISMSVHQISSTPPPHPLGERCGKYGGKLQAGTREKCSRPCQELIIDFDSIGSCLTYRLACPLPKIFGSFKETKTLSAVLNNM